MLDKKIEIFLYFYKWSKVKIIKHIAGKTLRLIKRSKRLQTINMKQKIPIAAKKLWIYEKDMQNSYPIMFTLFIIIESIVLQHTNSATYMFASVGAHWIKAATSPYICAIS